MHHKLDTQAQEAYNNHLHIHTVDTRVYIKVYKLKLTEPTLIVYTNILFMSAEYLRILWPVMWAESHMENIDKQTRMHTCMWMLLVSSIKRQSVCVCVSV